MIPSRTLAVAAMIAAALLTGPHSALAGAVTDLPIGDPARRERLVRVALDAPVDTQTGKVLDLSALVQRLSGTRILLIGEEHTNSEFHAVELRVIRALAENGRAVRIGLEMFPYTVQAPLEDWSHDLLTEDGFIDKSDWYGNWGYNFGYYRDIFDYARALRLPLYGVNLPSAAIRTIRKDGYDALAPAERSHLPPQIDLTNAEHQRLYRAYFGADDPLHGALTPEQQAGMYRVQVAWDAAMGWNAAKALAADPDPTAIMVVLLGEGHVAYGLGAEHQLAGQFAGKVSTLIPVSVRDAEFAPVTQVRASYADFVWGVPPQIRPELPTLGVSLASRLGGGETNRVIEVEPGSAAALAGVAAGDLLLRLDGRSLDAPAALQRLLSSYRWGDEVRLELRRGDHTRVVPVMLRTEPDDAASAPR